MLIIYAHPNKLGHCGLILSEVKKGLEEKKVPFEVLDLYEMGYDPVMRPEEHYTSGNSEVSEENQKIQEMIKNEDRFIFIYPTWWNGPPAILKGFLDRVMLPRFAFVYEGGLPKPLLKGKAVVFTSTGAPRFVARWYFKDGSLKMLTRDVLRFCGIRSMGFVIDRATKMSKRQEEKVTKTVLKGLKFLIKRT